MKPILLCLIAFLVTFQLQSQVPQKIGHADWQFIFSQLPEYRQIEEELKSFDTQLKTQLKQKGMELEAKYKGYKALPVTTLETIKKDKESELTYLQQNLQKFTEEPGFLSEEAGRTCDTGIRLNPQTTEGADILLFADNKYVYQISFSKSSGFWLLR